MGLRFFAAALVGLGGFGTASAQYTWSGAGTNDLWNNGANWTGASGFPGAGDTVTYNGTDTDGTTDINGTRTVQSFAVDAGRHTFLGGTINVTPGGATFTVNGGRYIFGADGTIGDANNVRLNGGRLDVNGFSDAVANLRLTADSILSFSANDAVQRLDVADIVRTAGLLTVTGWNSAGSAAGASNVGKGGTLFSAGTVGSAVLENIQFAGFAMGAIQLGSGEIVPVPEPGAALLAAGLGLAGVRAARRRAARAGAGGESA